MTKILIIDDEDLFREDLALILRHYGNECRTAANANDGVRAAREFFPDIILCDLVMPDKTGLEILEELRSICPESHVIMITAFGNMETAVEAFRKGAVDYILKPIVKEDILKKIERLRDFNRLNLEVQSLRRLLSHEQEKHQLIGQSEPILKVHELVRKVGSSKSTVLITGESGTGKELVAKEIHLSGKNKDSPFIPINCANIPGELLESELFGHIRGAFTGAINNRKGYFELAESGTVLLDEIGDMPLNLQSKLLRVLEQKEFIRIGDTETRQLKARIIASTNKTLTKLVQTGDFREDLYYRINVFEIHVPSLKECRSDIPLLTELFVARYNQELKRKCLGFDNESMQVLLSYSWPGNVRQLRNVVERAMILNQEEYITIEHLPSELTGGHLPGSSGENLKEAVKAFETEYIKRILSTCQGNREKTARRLGINASTLYRKMPDLKSLAE